MPHSDSYAYIDYNSNNRTIVDCDYESAKLNNKELFLQGHEKATKEYTYNNQKADAVTILHKFYKEKIRAISILKKTKMGANGFMIEIARLMSTHIDDDFMLHRKNIFFTTGMSSISWEEDLKNTIPQCFKDNVYHHGKLQKLEDKLKNIKNALIIIDEIDVGDGHGQRLHNTLKNSGLLDIKYVEDNNIRFIFISATMQNPMKELIKWGDKHFICKMTKPEDYIGYEEFLELGIIKQYYPVNDNESAEKWIREDILDNYGSDYRVHIIRTCEKNKEFIMNACKKNNIEFTNHTSVERISFEELSNIFNNVTRHLVIAIKGLWSRADFIPNKWKMKIGAIHELYVKKHNTPRQTQGLIGRLTGVWKPEIINGHKTGPYRTSIESMREQKEFDTNPCDQTTYSTNSKKSFLDPTNFKLSINQANIKKKDKAHKVFEKQEDAIKFAKKTLGANLRKRPNDTAPKELQIVDETSKRNPSVCELLKRMWGISEKNRVRMIPTDDKKWCLYWKPSMMDDDSEEEIEEMELA